MKVFAFVCLLTITHAQNDDGKMDKFLKDVLKTMTNINKIEKTYIPEEAKEHDSEKNLDGVRESNYEGETAPRKRSHQRNFHDHRNLGRYELHKFIHSKKYKSRGPQKHVGDRMDEINTYKSKMPKHLRNKFRKQYHRYHPKEYREYDYGEMKRLRRAIAKRPGVSFEDEEDDISSQDNEDKLRGNANPEQISFQSNQGFSEIPLKPNEFSPYDNQLPLRTYSDDVANKENDHTSTQNSNVNFQLDPYDSKDITYDKRHSGSEPSQLFGKEKADETGYTDDYPHIVSMFDGNTFKKDESTYIPVHDISKVSGNLQNPLSSTKDPLHVKDDLRGIKLFVSNSIPEQEKENLQKLQELSSETVSPIDMDNLHGGQIVSSDIGLAGVRNGIQDTYGDVREHSRKSRNKNYWTELVNDLILQNRNNRAKNSISKIDKNNKKNSSKRKVYEMSVTNSSHPNKRQVKTNEIYREFPMQYNQEQEIQGIMRNEPRINSQNQMSIHGTKMKSKKRTIFSSGNERKAINKHKGFKQGCSNDEKGFQVNIIKPMIVEVKYPGLTDNFNDHYVYERSADYNKDHLDSKEGSSRFQSDILKKSISENKSDNGETIALSENTILKKGTSGEKRDFSGSTERETSQRKRDVSRSENFIESDSKQNGSSLASGELRFKKDILQTGGNKLYEGGIQTGRKGRKLLSEDEKDLSAFSRETQGESYKGKAILSGLETIWKHNNNKSDEGKNKRIENSNAKINSGSVSPIATTIISNKENVQYVANQPSHSSEKQELKNKNIIETSLKLQPEKLTSNTEEHLKDSASNSLTSHLENTNKEGIAELQNNFPNIIETKPLKEEETIVSSQVTEKEDKRSYNKDSVEHIDNHLLGKKGASVDGYSNQKRVDEEEDELKGKTVSFQNNRIEKKSPATNEEESKVDRHGIDKNSEEDTFNNLIKEKDNSPQLTNSFNGVGSELFMDIPRTSTEAVNSIKRDTSLLGQWEEKKFSDTKNSNSVQSRSANFSFPETIKRLFHWSSNEAKKPGTVSKVFKTNLENSVKNSFTQPIRELTESDNQYHRQFSPSSFKSLPHMVPSGLIKSDNQIQHQTSDFNVIGSFQQPPSELLKSNNRIQSQFSENNIFDKSDKKSTKPDYQFHGFLFPGTKEKNSIGQSSGTFIKSDNQFQGIIKSDDQFHSKASGYTKWNDQSDNARGTDRKNNIYPTLQNNREDDSNEGNNGIPNSATFSGANINSTMRGQQKMSNLRISPSEYSDVSQMRPTISGDLASEILDDIFVKVNSSIHTKHHIGDALSKTDYSSMNSQEAESSEINYKLEEEDYRTRCTRVLQEVSRLIQCLIAQEVKKKSCITLEPDLQDFLSWLLEPESQRENLYSDQDNFLFNRNENYENEEPVESNNAVESEDESDEDTEDTEASDECQVCKKDKCRPPQCGRCKYCRNAKRKARAQDIDHGIEQLNSLLSEYDRLSNFEKRKLEDLQGLLSKKLVELHSFLRTDLPVDEGFYEEFNDENYFSNEANMKHEMQKYHQPIAHKDFAQFRRHNTPEPTHDNEIQKSEEKPTTESVSDSKLIEEQLVKLGLHPGKTKNVVFNPTSEPTEEYEQLARKVDEYRRKRRVMYH